MEHRINQKIRVPKVRLIDEKGENKGIMDTYRARQYAQERDLDLVEISPQAQPPVCMVVDYGKWKYQQKKKSKGNQTVRHETKELVLRPGVGEADYQTKLRQARTWLTKGHTVKVTVRFKGREAAHPELGENLVTRLHDDVEDLGKYQSALQKTPQRIVATLMPKN